MLMNRVIASLLLVAAQTLVLLATQIVALSAPDSACLTTSTQNCIFTDTGEPCGSRIVVPADQCGDREVKVSFTYCNKSEKNIIFIEDETIGKFRELILDVDKSKMTPNECREVAHTGLIDTCKKKFVASLQVQGWLEGHWDIDGYYCREWEFLKVTMENTQAGGREQSCEMTTEVACTYDDDNSICEDYDFNYSHCEERDVTITYKICNKMKSDDIEFLNDVTTAKFRQDIQYIDKSRLGPGDCTQSTHQRTVNNCNDKKFVMSLKAEGWVNGDVNGKYCFGWDFSEVKLNKPNFKFINECHMKLKDSNEWNQCSDEEITDRDKCERELRYTYTIKNEGDHEIEIRSIMLDTLDRKDLDLLPVDSNFIPQEGSYKYYHYEDKNLCEINGQVQNDPIAVVANQFGGASSTKEDKHVFTVSAPLSSMVMSDLECNVNGQSCYQYIEGIDDPEDCVVDVLLTYNIMNDGYGCEEIEIAQSFINDGSAYTIALPAGVCNDNRMLCAGDKWPIEQVMTLDMCSFSSSSTPFEVKLNNDDTNLMDAGVLNLPAPPIIFSAFPTLSPTNNLPCTKLPTEITFRYKSQSCAESDNSINHRFLKEKKDKHRTDKKKENDNDDTGKKDKNKNDTKNKNKNNEDDKKNNNRNDKYDKDEKKNNNRNDKYDKDEKKNKTNNDRNDKKNKHDDSHNDFLCEESITFPFDGVAYVTITDYTTNKPVVDGDIITVIDEKGFVNDLCVDIYSTLDNNRSNNNKIQEMKIHASCSEELFIGDTFGSLEVVGFINEDGKRGTTTF